MRSPQRSRLAGALVSLALLTAAGSGCSVVDDLTGNEEAVPSAAPSPVAEAAYDSQFTRDGTFQSHINYRGLDFVYTLYPTKSTPRTNEWFPLGKKYFTVTFQAYDLDRGLRDPFDTKREVYLRDLKVTSSTVLADGTPGADRPYKLNAKAAQVTFDPQPLGTADGMLVTSPKGAFELRNQEIGEVGPDTRGVELAFTATVFVETRAGSDEFTQRKVRQKVPIAIFASDVPTTVTPIPINAN